MSHLAHFSSKTAAMLPDNRIILLPRVLERSWQFLSLFRASGKLL